MFGPFRRFPFRGLALVALGFLLASVLTGGASGAAAGVGLALAVALFLFKMLFLFFIFGSLLRLVGGGPAWGRGPSWGHGGPWSRRTGESSHPNDDEGFDRERRDWEESLRQAREELREYDSPFSRPPRGFEPTADEPED